MWLVLKCFNVLTERDNYEVRSLENISLCVFSPEEYPLIPHSKAFILTSLPPTPSFLPTTSPQPSPSLLPPHTISPLFHRLIRAGVLAHSLPLSHAFTEKY